jgi:F-type H+-transporting ATPase subunit gamma
MASARDIRRRIKSVKNIQQITQAMKLVASARLQKAQTRVQAARPYAAKIQQIISDLAAPGTAPEHPLLEVRDEQRVAAIVIGADRGLAGSYPANVVRLTQRFLSERGGQDVTLHVMGKKSIASIRKLGATVGGTYELPGTDVDFATVRPISRMVQTAFENREVDAVYLIFTEFRSAMSQKAVVQRLLPVVPPSAGQNGYTGTYADFLFEPAPAELLAHLLSRYVDTLLFRAVLEAVASEQGARMTAMSTATTNAGEMIERLTLSLNRARQAAITAEIAEIVGAADAIS